MSAMDAIFEPSEPAAPPPEQNPVVPVVPEKKEPAAPEKPDDIDEPDDGKPGRFKSFKAQKEAELESLRADYETRLAEITGKATEHETKAKSAQDQLTQLESLKAAHEAKLAELEKQIVEDYETPYSLDVDPEAAPHFGVFEESRSQLDAAVASVATSLGEDVRSVNLIISNKQLFGQLMVEMSKGLEPDVVHAEKLVAGLAKAGVTVSREDARLAVRDLKSALPTLMRLASAQRNLQTIEAKNKPNWQQQQAARHEAYRRQVKGYADVAENADGDDAVIAGVLKGRPELKERLNQEADKISSMIIGPAPGKATADTVRATPKTLHETAVKAARLPVMIAAYQDARTENETLKQRVAELEARIAGDSGSVPRSNSAGGNTGPAKAKGFDAAMDEIFGPK